MSAVAAKPRASKHKKKAWKHIDLVEIDRYQQDKELDERTGQTGKPTFFISNEASSENLDSKLNKNRKIDAENATRQIVDNLKVYKHLKSTSKVPAFQTNEPIHPKQPVLNHIRLKEKEKRSVENALKRKQQRLVDANEKRKKRSRAFNLWEEKEKTPVHGAFCEFEEDFEHLHLAQLGKCHPKPTNHLHNKPSLVSACEAPHPGISYNPDEEQHTELLLQVANKKKKEIREKKKQKRKLTEHLLKGVDVEAENMKDMMQGLSDFDKKDNSNKEESSNNIEEDDEEEEEKPAVVLPSDLKRRKTKKHARHDLMVKQLKKLADQRKQMKKFNSEFFKIRQYLREYAMKVKLSKQRRQVRAVKEEQKKYQPARLGRQKYIEQDQEFNLPSELQGSMRKLATDGNLLVDRFKSFQKRNLIEHRVVLKLGKAKAKRKKVVNPAIFNRDFFALKSQSQS